MMKARSISITAIVASLFGVTFALAQVPANDPNFDPEKLRREMEAFVKMPDTSGTGKYPALKEEVASLPNHVIYRPADLAKLGKEKLGVLAFGNGGCSADGAGARFHLAEIASHGYLAIANGKILSGPGAPSSTAPPMPPPPASGQPRKFPPPATKATDLVEAINWALKENARRESPYYGRINPKWIAVSGWSCGGLQALQIAASDSRVRTTIIHNSGIFPPGVMNSDSGMDIGKDTLKKLHAPVIYILGGPTDIAYANGMDDFKHIDQVPAFMANTDAGHGGTFIQPNGGRVALVDVNWLDWQFKGSKQAEQQFVGADCALCKDPQWKLEVNNFPAQRTK
jgi:hypothetical protein